MLKCQYQEPLENQLPKLPLPGSPVPADAAAILDIGLRLDTYLDRVFAPLAGALTAQQQQERREEMRLHMQEMIAAYEELGETPSQALALTLQKFGSPQALAQQWRRAPGLRHQGYAAAWASSRYRNVHTLACMLTPPTTVCFFKALQFFKVSHSDYGVNFLATSAAPALFAFLFGLFVPFPIGLTWWQRSLKQNILAVCQPLLSTFVFIGLLMLCLSSHGESAEGTRVMVEMLSGISFCSFAGGFITSYVVEGLHKAGTWVRGLYC